MRIQLDHVEPYPNRLIWVQFSLFLVYRAVLCLCHLTFGLELPIFHVKFFTRETRPPAGECAELKAL